MWGETGLIDAVSFEGSEMEVRETTTWLRVLFGTYCSVWNVVFFVEDDAGLQMT